MTKKILFVCLGNICRSPTAHAVMRSKSRELKLAIEIESAGTSASHRGEKPDSRSMREGSAAGYHFDGIVSRPVKDSDFTYYDVILAMDRGGDMAVAASELLAHPALADLADQCRALPEPTAETLERIRAQCGTMPLR